MEITATQQEIFCREIILKGRTFRFFYEKSFTCPTAKYIIRENINEDWVKIAEIPRCLFPSLGSMLMGELFLHWESCEK